MCARVWWVVIADVSCQFCRLSGVERVDGAVAMGCLRSCQLRAMSMCFVPGDVSCQFWRRSGMARVDGAGEVGCLTHGRSCQPRAMTMCFVSVDVSCQF